MTGSVTTADGTRLAMSERGDPSGPTVVCVHGYPDNRSLWNATAENLADHHRVVTYDVRGAGSSDRPRDRRAYHLDILASDLATVLGSVSPDRPVHLLAHDWGSIQCWHAVTDPRLRDRIASFTSISGPCLDHAAHWMREQARARTPRSMRNLVRQLACSGYIGFFQLPWIPELAWRSGIMPRAVSLLGDRSDRPALHDGLHGLQLYRANMTGHFRRPQQRPTDVAVQVLVPTRDAFVTAPLQTEITRWVPDLRVRRIRGGHWIPLERPDAIAVNVAEHVDRVESRRAPGSR